MNKKIIPVLALSLTSVLALPSCMMKDNQTAIDQDLKTAQEHYKNMQYKNGALVSHSDRVYLSNEAFKITKKTELPPIFNKKVVYTTGLQEGVVATMQNISSLTGMMIKFSDDAAAALAKLSMPAGGMSSYHDTFQHVLTQITSKFGLYWSYQDGYVQVFSVETMVYSLDAPVGSFGLTNSITSTASGSGGGSSSSGGSGGSSGGGSSGSGTTVTGNSSMTMNYNVDSLNPWDAAVKTIKNMLSPLGRMDVNPSAGYVTVTDTPISQQKIADYVQKVNDRTHKKIAVKIEVYDVKLTKSSSAGLDLNAVSSILGGKMSLATAGSTAVINAATSGVSSITYESSSTTKSVLSALNTVGEATEVTSSTIYTISGQPAPIQSMTQTNYLASSATTIADTAGTATSTLTPGTVSTGYSMTVTPRIESNNQILVNLNLQLSSLLGITSIGANAQQAGSNGSTQGIQLPTVQSKNFLENMILHSGQSILIAGFEDTQGNSTTDSIGPQEAWIAGGDKSNQRNKTTTVVVVTPYIIGD